MANFQFRLSSKKNKLGRQELLMRFYHGKFQQRAKTGIFIGDKPIYWDGITIVNKARLVTEDVVYHREQKERLDNLCRIISEEWAGWSVKCEYYMAWRAFVGGLYHKVQDPNAIGSMTGHAKGSKAFARYRKVELELKKSLTDMLD